MKIIQSHFAKGADFGMLCQISQFVDPCVAADGIRIARVDADGNTHIRFVFDEAEQLARVIEVCGRGDHARDSCRSGTLEHGGEIGVELLAAKVSVRVEEHAVRNRISACGVKSRKIFHFAARVEEP